MIICLSLEKTCICSVRLSTSTCSNPRHIWILTDSLVSSQQLPRRPERDSVRGRALRGGEEARGQHVGVPREGHRGVRQARHQGQSGLSGGGGGSTLNSGPVKPTIRTNPDQVYVNTVCTVQVDDLFGKSCHQP